MKKSIVCLVMIVLLLSLNRFAFAHFGMLIPSDSMVMQTDSRVVNLTLSFSHPFERRGMEMVKPKVF
ncbi:MAG: DUF4198 domain-containing protein, partial [Thermodesulfobacteriota bacterium]|nr:DUF4198 domain-containing protein [Thermodesulfobacteriota bacterium]